MGFVDLLLSIVAGVALWVLGTVVFDGVHWLLHKMLASRQALLRALAWPHGVHHRWLDRQLQTNWELQRANVFCHLVPEYLTQLAFSGLAALVLPSGPVWVCVGLQTALFGYLLSQRGLDVNHRAVEILDAHRPGWLCPPAYHALHHVYPDAHFSAYTKLVDTVVGGAAQLAGRRFGVTGDGPLAQALGDALERQGGRVSVLTPDAEPPGHLDVLVVCDASRPAADRTEAFIAAAGDRLLPPEVWAVHDRAGDAEARHYVSDPRVAYRVLFAGEADLTDPREASCAARRALFLVRRGAHFVPLGRGFAAWRARRRFRATAPRPPDGVPRVRSRRAAWTPAAASAWT